ncbi:cytosol aminopeptidase-like [Leptidea sinapis]|uniref:cytosol aminopeptidase-like n=1 Tax=Leptidea sinapis TaxID=189913 RepID=UPI002133D3C4|nr:cytosol aminopeptidase-like [Leptidea sinapis]
MAFTKLFSSARLLSLETYLQRTIRGCCHTAKETATNAKSEDVTSSGGQKKGLVLGVYEDNKRLTLTAAAEELNQKSGGKLDKHLNELSGELKLGKAFVVTDVPEYSAVALAGIGRCDAAYNKLEELDEAQENVRQGVGAAVLALRDRGSLDIAVDGGAHPRAAAEAAHLAAWNFQEFKSSENRKEDAKLSLHGTAGSEQWELGSILGRAQNWARYLSDMPANKMTPTDVAQAALDVLCPLGVRVSVRDRHWIEAQKMEAFLAVARGSCEAPVFIECQYNAGSSTAPVLLAAKGIAFDCGGLCLKAASEMSENRGSMAGAAAVLGAMYAVALAKAPLNVNAVIPVCENMVSGQCMKVGDVVTALNGLTIQIEDTDMEGRLILADALVYGQVMYKPSLVIDVATLTHGILLATGGGAFGCFSNSEALWRALQHAGSLTGDRGWRFPLWHYYRQHIHSDPAVDILNRGSGNSTPCIGAAFLQNFICGDWLHLDITGVGKLSHSPAPTYLHPHRMTGRPTRTLATFLMNSTTDEQQPPVNA